MFKIKLMLTTSEVIDSMGNEYLDRPRHIDEIIKKRLIDRVQQEIDAYTNQIQSTSFEFDFEDTVSMLFVMRINTDDRTAYQLREQLQCIDEFMFYFASDNEEYEVTIDECDVTIEE